MVYGFWQVMFGLTLFLGNETEDTEGMSCRGGVVKREEYFERSLTMQMTGRRRALTSLQTRLIRPDGPLVHHARRLVFKLAEVLVTKDSPTGTLERISQNRLAPE